eukprot:m.112521 g.112521  ORF g.112521 m.112521 type:complete len:258 (+) comp15412_c0_seq3:440-1213(+)
MLFTIQAFVSYALQWLGIMASSQEAKLKRQGLDYIAQGVAPVNFTNDNSITLSFQLGTWPVKTDATERTEIGQSLASAEAYISNESQASEKHVSAFEFKGRLATLPASRGGYVGFCRAAMPTIAAAALQGGSLAFSARAGSPDTASIVYSVLVDVDQTRLGPVLSQKPLQRGNTITYQTDFQVQTALSTLQIELAQFRPTRRGQTVDGAPRLTWDMVTGLGFTVLRSRQLVPAVLNQMDAFHLVVQPACWRVVVKEN